MTCTPQATALSGDSSNCSAGAMLRTDGDSAFPCEVRSRAVRDTYLCHVNLPSGALIEEVLVYGRDSSALG